MKSLYAFLLLITLAGCSKIPSVEQEQVEVLTPYPNPADDRINIRIRNDEKAAYLIQVFDPKAKLILEENVPAGSPKNSFLLDLTETDKGSYHAILKMGAAVYSKKFLKI